MRFPDDHFSDENLKGFLVREGFIDAAVHQVAKIYQENLSYLKLNKVDESGGNASTKERESHTGDAQNSSGGASVGDLVQWEIDGVLQLERPARVYSVHDSGDWIFVEGRKKGIPMDQITVQQAASSAPQIPPAAPKLDPPALAPAQHNLVAVGGESEWVRTPLGKGVFARILVTEDLSDGQIEKLRTVLEAMKEGD